MPGTPVTKSAIYMRVSKDDGSQDPDNQLPVLKEEIERAGEELVEVYIDRETGTKGRRERSDFDRMFRDAERRQFELLRFWALDRFSREGIRKTIGYLQRLDHLGVRFKSQTEPYLNTDNELIAHIVLGVTSYYAQLEAQRISDRTKAGLARARAQGKVIGRPDGYERWQSTIEEMLQRDFGKKRISRETGLSYNTVKSYLQRMEDEKISEVSST
jgi:DNA invertase Pin-like site-specific DNA recombinase